MAVYIATSARRMSVPPSVPWSGHRAMPTDGLGLERQGADVDGVRHRQADPLGHRAGAGLVGVVDDDGELVASEPGDEVPGADRSVSRLANSTSRRSPTWWPKRVVDPLEVVHVDGISPNGALPLVALQRVVELEAQRLAVGQAGEVVVTRRCSRASDFEAV